MRTQQGGRQTEKSSGSVMEDQCAGCLSCWLPELLPEVSANGVSDKLVGGAKAAAAGARRLRPPDAEVAVNVGSVVVFPTEEGKEENGRR